MAAPVCDMCGGKRGRLFTSFPVKDGELCSKCYDKMTFIIKTLKLKKEFKDFTVDEAKQLASNFDIAKNQSAGLKRIVDSHMADENGELHCVYCQKVMKVGLLKGFDIKQGKICDDCYNKATTAKRFVKGAYEDLSRYTIKDLDILFKEYEKYKDNLSNDKREYIENEEKSIAKGGIGQFFKELGDEGLKRKAEKAISEAYRIEQEKRTPHIKRIEHQRPLTPQEQQSIDMLEMEALKYASSQSEKMYGGSMSSSEKTGAFVNTLFMGDEYQRKIDEIKSRAVWYEDVQVPPEIDPNTPIFVDEEAIKKRIYGDRYIAITESSR